MLSAVVAALAAGLVLYSQTIAFYGDEGFHLLAALLINAGKRPYLDFFYQHVPLYAYLTAGWFHFVGQGWRSAHLLSALYTGAAIWLAAGLVCALVREPAWRVPAAVIAALLFGLHAGVIQYATVGHPYGFCLLLMMAAFRLTITAVHRERAWWSAGAGLCAGGAVASSLLAVPVLPILFFWMLRHHQVGDRGRKAIGFLAGAAIPFLPLLWLAAQGFRQTWFNILEFHVFHRRDSMPGTIVSDLRMLTSLWLESPQGLVPALLAAVGWLFSRDQTEWDPTRRAELALCVWLTLGLGILAACALPTHPAYFVLMIPFLSILASVGTYAIGSRVWWPDRPAWVILLVLGLYVMGLAKPAYQMGKDLDVFMNRWPSRVDVAREVNRVTPEGGEVWADEFIYVAAGRVPPSGLESFYPYDLRLLPASDLPIKLVPQSQLDTWLGAGRFATVAIEVEDPRIEALGLARRYSGHSRVHGYEIFWGRRMGDKKDG